MIIEEIPTEKWVSLHIAGEVREEVNTMKVDDILKELGHEPNSENRFEFKAELLNRFIRENGLNLSDEDRKLKELQQEIEHEKEYER